MRRKLDIPAEGTSRGLKASVGPNGHVPKALEASGNTSPTSFNRRSPCNVDDGQGDGQHRHVVEDIEASKQTLDRLAAHVEGGEQT